MAAWKGERTSRHDSASSFKKDGFCFICALISGDRKAQLTKDGLGLGAALTLKATSRWRASMLLSLIGISINFAAMKFRAGSASRAVPRKKSSSSPRKLPSANNCNVNGCRCSSSLFSSN